MTHDWSQVQEDCPLRHIVPALSSPVCMVSASSNRAKTSVPDLEQETLDLYAPNGDVEVVTQR